MEPSETKVLVQPAGAGAPVVQATVVGSQQGTLGAAPVIQSMEQHLEGSGVMLKQRTSECCRCFCCQPNISWNLHPPHQSGEAVGFDDLKHPAFWIQEDAEYCDRTWSCWAPGCRPTVYRTVPASHKEDIMATDAQSLLTHKKGRTCGQNVIVMWTQDGPIRCPMCCCLPNMETYDQDGTKLGSTEYECDECLFVPKFRVLDAADTAQYLVRPDTCVGGLCVKCKCGGPKGKCCRVPFYIRDVNTREPLDDRKAVITDLFAGLKAECCTRKNIYNLTWPSAASRAMRATLIGAALLIDITIYEQDGA